MLVKTYMLTFQPKSFLFTILAMFSELTINLWFHVSNRELAFNAFYSSCLAGKRTRASESSEPSEPQGFHPFVEQ